MLEYIRDPCYRNACLLYYKRINKIAAIVLNLYSLVFSTCLKISNNNESC